MHARCGTACISKTFLTKTYFGKKNEVFQKLFVAFFSKAVKNIHFMSGRSFLLSPEFATFPNTPLIITYEAMWPAVSSVDSPRPSLWASWANFLVPGSSGSGAGRLVHPVRRLCGRPGVVPGGIALFYRTGRLQRTILHLFVAQRDVLLHPGHSSGAG